MLTFLQLFLCSSLTTQKDNTLIREQLSEEELKIYAREFNRKSDEQERIYDEIVSIEEAQSKCNICKYNAANRETNEKSTETKRDDGLPELLKATKLSHSDECGHEDSKQKLMRDCEVLNKYLQETEVWFNQQINFHRAMERILEKNKLSSHQ